MSSFDETTDYVPKPQPEPPPSRRRRNARSGAATGERQTQKQMNMLFHLCWLAGAVGIVLVLVWIAVKTF